MQCGLFPHELGVFFCLLSTPKSYSLYKNGRTDRDAILAWHQIFTVLWTGGIFYWCLMGFLIPYVNRNVLSCAKCSSIVKLAIVQTWMSGGVALLGQMICLLCEWQMTLLTTPDSRVTIISVEWCTVHFTRKIGLELGDIIWKHASPTETSWCSFLPSVCWSSTEKMFCICIIWVLTQSTMMWLKCSFFF